MNTANALVFTLLGSVMGFLPAVFPSWFPHNGVDEASSRALWMSLMGAIQLGMGIAFLIHALLFPTLLRLATHAPTVGPGTIVLPAARGAQVR